MFEATECAWDSLMEDVRKDIVWAYHSPNGSIYFYLNGLLGKQGDGFGSCNNGT